MAYKDKDRQKQAVKEATRRYRRKLKGITPEAIVIPDHPVPVIPLKQSLRITGPLTKERQVSQKGFNG